MDCTRNSLKTVSTRSPGALNFCAHVRSRPCTRAFHHTQNLAWVLGLLKVRKNGQQKTCATCFATFCKRVEKRYCASYHPCSNLLTTWSVARQVLCGWYNAQHRDSTRFAAMLHVFCCPFFRTFSVRALAKSERYLTILLWNRGKCSLRLKRLIHRKWSQRNQKEIHYKTIILLDCSIHEWKMYT